jgi:hypothetical protein
MNQDGVVNVVDVQIVIDAAIGLGCAPANSGGGHLASFPLSAKADGRTLRKHRRPRQKYGAMRRPPSRIWERLGAR